MTDTAAVAERVTKRDLVEGNAEKVVNERTELVEMSRGGGVDYANLRDMVDAAKLLSAAGPMIPPWLQGNVGGMFGICMKAQELGISALSLANWSYVVENKGVSRVAYESQFFHAVIEQRAPLKKRIEYEIIGEGDDRRCRVWGTLKGEDKPREFLSDTLGNLRPEKNQYGQTKGSPLWDKKPDLQLFYNASRDFARVYFPDIIAGMYGRDEMEEAEIAHQGARHAKDVSPRLAERLTGPGGEGFAGASAPQNIDAALAAARAPPADIKPPAAARKARQA
ncbi:MAG TPA: recombinase RecT, partial [Candidatus Saccharimonadales bacterium]|nr:recombinase RecT [Candidatus Saccharimonadales bacterium]